MSVFDLNSIDGSNGVVFTSSNAGDNFAFSTASGDFNCDGNGDFAVSAISNPGAVYIFYGGQNSYPTSITAQSLNHTTGAIIYGIKSTDQFGFHISNIGDFNGDKCDDLAIGAPSASPSGQTDIGQVYILYGSSNITTPISVGEFNGLNGFTITGANAKDTLGSSLGGMRGGDINGDGKDDLLIGAPGANNKAGMVYAIYGSKNLPDSFSIKDLNATMGVTFQGIYNAGISVNMAGDANNDGFCDMLFSLEGVNNNQGAAVLYYGNSTMPSTVKMSSIGKNGMEIIGNNAQHINVGYGINQGYIGDVNGDGKADFAVEVDSTYSTQCCSEVIVIYGSSKPYPRTITYSEQSPSIPIAGFIMTSSNGASTFLTGPMVPRTAGDFNNDGIDDIVIASGVVFGSSTRGNNNICIYCGTNAPGMLHFEQNGNYFYGTPSGNIDFNNDGVSDVILGAWYQSKAYAIFGSSFFSADEAQLLGDLDA